MHEFVVALSDQSGHFFWGGTRNPFPAEAVFWVVVLAVAALLMLRPRTFAGTESWLRRIARRRVLSVVMVGLLALALRAALLPLIPIPEPGVHDEFSYLLQSDTFASGRLTNPPLPMWVYFESFHINVLPTYQSMYPPAQATFLAAAQYLTRQPWLGVWFSVGLMCAAICWMLQAWMPPLWALLGGLFSVLRFAVFGMFVNSYYGGAVAALGGALMIGAIGRLRRRISVRDSLVLAVGLVLMANSRPYEGFVLALAAAPFLLVWAWPRGLRQFVVKLAVPAAAVLVVAGACMLYYNWRGTGNPLLMPYKANQARYHITNSFLWDKRNPTPVYYNAVMRKFYIYHELADYLRFHNYSDGFYEIWSPKLNGYYSFYLWPLVLLIVPTCWEMAKSRKGRFLVVLLAAEFVALMVIIWPPQPQYPAPVLGVVIALALYGLRLLRVWRRHGRPLGMAMSRAIVFVMLCWLVFVCAQEAINPYHLNDRDAYIPGNLERARIKAQLERTPGLQLVFVRSRRDHDPGNDWVYNRADINHAKIIWARDLGPEMDQDLLNYYRNRHAWIVDQDDGIHRLTDYESRPELVTSSAAMKLVTNRGN